MKTSMKTHARTTGPIKACLGRIVAATIGLLVLQNHSVEAQILPSIDIGGLTGASHWMWVEAENATGSSSGGPASWNYWGASGSANPITDPALPSGYVTPFAGAPHIEWGLHIPAAMAGSNTLWVNQGVWANNYTVDVQLDGGSIGSYQTVGDGNQNNYVYWTSGNLTGITGGDHTLRFQAGGGYNEYGWDGFLIYNGALSSNPMIAAQGDRYWTQAPTPDSYPTISLSGSTSISVTNAFSYSITLNGVAYTPGDPIGPGDHQLIVEAFGTAGGNRILAGADFSIVPEPTTVSLLLGLGAALLFARRRRIR